jgi:hypothetical protein
MPFSGLGETEQQRLGADGSVKLLGDEQRVCSPDRLTRGDLFRRENPANGFDDRVIGLYATKRGERPRSLAVR